MKKRFLLDVGVPIYLNTDLITAVRPAPDSGSANMPTVSVYFNSAKFDLPICKTNIDLLDKVGWKIEKDDLIFMIKDF
jgi:hypothetical protein